MAIGLKSHSHADREKIIRALIPLVKEHVGNSLVALAASGSFARGDDGPYSDIEMFAFVASPADSGAVRFIHDGILIDIWLITREDYLRIHKKSIQALSSDIWPFTAANTLMPLLNVEFVNELRQTPYAMSEIGFRTGLITFWPSVQEATAKFLTAVERNDRFSVSYLYWLALEKICCALSFLNGTPFSTRAKIFEETLQFAILPPSFGKLLVAADQEHSDRHFGDLLLKVFEELEHMLSSNGFALYAGSLSEFVDPALYRSKRAENLPLGRAVARVRRIPIKLQKLLTGSETP